MAFWELGVAHPPIYNRSFRAKKVFNRFLSAAASGTGLSIGAVSNEPNAEEIFVTPNLTSIISERDKVIVGPSTLSGYEGKVEERLVYSASGNNIVLSDSLLYIYDIGDPVTLYGSSCPDGWIWNIDNYAPLSSNSMWTGYDDLCAFSGRLKQELGILIPSVIYRLSAYVKVGATPNYFSMSSSFYTNFISVTVPGVAVPWQYISNYATSSTTESYPAAINILFNGSSIIDCINLQFGWTGDDGTGKFIFNEIPSDIVVKNRDRMEVQRLLSGYNNSLLNPSQLLYDKKVVLTCEFSNTQTSTGNLFQALKTYEEIQNRGFFLSLKTDLLGISPFIVGRMTINKIKSPFYSTGVRDFSFTFEELL